MALIPNDMDKFLQEAIETYERNINGVPPFYMDADTLMQIEEYYEKNGRNFDAQQCLHYAELLHPDDTEVLIAKAYQLKADGKWEEAERIIKSIPNQDHREVVLYKAEWFAMSGMPDKAEQFTVRHIAQDIDDTARYDWYVDISEVLMNYGYIQRAIVWLEKIDSSYCDYKHVLELIADAYNQLMDYEHASAAATRMTDLDPYDSNAWCMLADIQQKYGYYIESLRSVEYALAIDPKSKLGMSLKVFNTFALNHKKNALDLVADFTKKAPMDYSMDMYAAENLLTDSSADEQKTLKHLLNALGNCPQGNPDRVRILTDLSMLYAHMHDADKAEEALMATISAGISLSDILWKLHYVLFNAELREESIRPLAKLAGIKDLEASERSEIYRILVRNRWFQPARDVWMALKKQVVPQDKFCQTYLAFALYLFKDAEGFLMHLQYSLLETDEALHYFNNLFSSTDKKYKEAKTASEIMTYANELVKTWQEVKE